MKILVTGVGGPAGSSLARQLHARGHRVIGADMVPTTDPLLDAFHQVPAASQQLYPARLQEIVLAHSVELVIPTVSEELPVLSAASIRELLESAGARLLISSEESVLISDDKYYTMLTLRGDNVPVPDFARINAGSGEALAQFSPEEQIIIKPRVSRGGRGVRLATAGDLGAGRVLAGTRDLVQRFAPGREFAPMIFRNPDSGEIEVCVVVEKTELREGLVGNAVSVRRCESNDPIAAHVAWVAKNAVQSLELVGPVDMDVRLGGDGQPVVLEVNARFGANSQSAPELLDAALRLLGVASTAQVGCA